MNRILKYILILFLLTAAVSCDRRLMETDTADVPCLPEGVPTTLVIPFGGSDMYEVEVSTKAASSAADEARIHDLYVFIFDKNNLVDGSPRKIYGRYFSYDHLKGSLAEVDSDDNECWYVQNVTVDGSVTDTRGAVKISTITCSDAKLVVIANVENAVTNMDGMDELERLNSVLHYDELRGIKVGLEQDVVNRKDLFLMTGERDVNTREMTWGSIVADTPAYSGHTVTLRTVDAKVKFRVKVNPDNISAVTPIYWQVCNTPDCCYLYSDYDGGAAPRDISHFESQQCYFEGTESDGVYTYYVFTFYMLENRQAPNNDSATSYYQRELREKIDSGDPGYKGPSGTGNEAFSDHFVENGDWLFAPTFGTYVRFDLILTLTETGISEISPEDPEGLTITQALTSDAIFTVHLGDFSSSGESDTDKLNNYQTLRSNFYTYTITINNTRSIYTEVTRDEENQSGQEGFLLLTDTEIINADCHYEYHQIEFTYRPDMSQDKNQDKYSWYVKTPFGEGGPVINKVGSNYTYDATGLDYLWVKFSVNRQVAADYSAAGDAVPDPEPWNSAGGLVRPYTRKRHAYPGDGHYDPSWVPGHKVDLGVPCDNDPNRDVPDLMDITQLIEYIFYQTRLEASTGSSDFIADTAIKEDDQEPVIRLTAFIDEYYYTHDPLNPGAPLDPDIWRKFVNASPREMHILSDAQQSRDRKSDVILSSHSIIQQSIQTIYNVYASNLNSLWGTEHQDEMRDKSQAGWVYWPKTLNEAERAGSFSTMVGKENGRLNSAYIWGFYSSQTNSGTDYTRPELSQEQKKDWETYLNYDVNNNTPELQEDYWGMAFSCLSRNRDNDGDGKIDRDEVRWYLAASNQLVGMWVGNESLSVHARLYRPAENQWRAHIISSSDKRVSWAEEGGGATEYSTETQKECWDTYEEAAKGESVRCLRNIGTYIEGGVRKDITEAPYTVEPERYFTITPEPDNNLNAVDNPATHYTISFDRINPKSLREFTDTDLPFSDQFSINNCVYVQMETQSRNDERLLMDSEGNAYKDYPYPYNLTLDQVNMEVDRLGMNPYCPPGYRFPNQSELLLMSVYLPVSYFLRDADGTLYDNTVWMPSRTYYDRGSIGRKTDGFEHDNEGRITATNREQCKVGWGYTISAKKNRSARIKTQEYSQSTNHWMKRSRCVRDIDHTGDITGGLLVKSELYPGDDAPITFSFNSSGSTFVSASLKFCYTDGNGTYHERDIPIQKTPSGLEFLADQTYSIPSISALGLTQSQLDLNDGELRKKTKFKITIRNAFASKTFEQPFTLGNPLTASLTLKGEVPAEVYPSDAKTVDIDFGTNANTCKLNTVSMKLTYKDKDNHDREVSAATLGIPNYTANTSLSYNHSDVSLNIPDLSTLNLPTDADFTRGANFVIELSDMGGSTFTKSVPVTLSNPLTVTNAFVLSDAVGNKIYPSDENHISVGVHSKASSFNISSVSMALCYGASTTIPITGIPSPEGTVNTYTLTNQAIDIPALASMTGLTINSLETGEPATIRLTVTAGPYTKTFESDALTISHPIAADEFSIDTANDKIYPGDSNTVTLTAAAKGNHPTNLTTATVQLYDGNTPMGSYIVNVSGINALTYTSSGSVTIPSLSDLGLSVSALNPGTPYTLRAIVSNADGLTRTIDKTLTLSNPVTGTMSADALIYPADNSLSHVTIDFSSAANTLDLSSATLTLEFTPPGGSLQQRSITLNSSPNSDTYSLTQAITIPTIHDLGLTAADLPLSANLRAEVSTAGGLSAVANAAVTIKSHYSGTIEILDDFNPTNGFPIRIVASSLTGSGMPVQNVKLRWKQQGALSYTEDTISVPAGEQSLTSNTITAYWYPSWLDNTSDVVGCVNGVNDATRTYYFTAVVGSSDANGAIDEGLIGLNAAVDEATMEFLKINYNPCPGNWTANNQPPNTLPYRWIPQAVSDMYFASGDFIDAYLDVSNCTYDPKQQGKVQKTDLGMDNLITFGPNTQTENIGGVSTALSWSNGNVLFYYPARNGSNNNLQIAVHGGSNDKISRVQPFDLPQDRLKIMLKRDLVNDKGVVLVNNYSPDTEHEPDWYSEEINTPSDALVTSTQGKLNNLTASNRQTVYVGSTEGTHRSRALYKYVRVVRKH